MPNASGLIIEIPAKPPELSSSPLRKRFASHLALAKPKTDDEAKSTQPRSRSGGKKCVWQRAQSPIWERFAHAATDAHNRSDSVATAGWPDRAGPTRGGEIEIAQLKVPSEGAIKSPLRPTGLLCGPRLALGAHIRGQGGELREVLRPLSGDCRRQRRDLRRGR